MRVVFHLDQDWNLVGVFCCAVEHQAIHAGFETEAGAQLARAAGDVCRETISQLGGNGQGVDVTLDTFSDRIEIAIHCRGQVLPAIGLETFALSDALSAGAAGLNGLELLSRVDRVLYNSEGGVARTTLVKFLPTQLNLRHLKRRRVGRSTDFSLWGSFEPVHRQPRSETHRLKSVLPNNAGNSILIQQNIDGLHDFRRLPILRAYNLACEAALAIDQVRFRDTWTCRNPWRFSWWRRGRWGRLT